jgi:hypothetical protein
MFEDWLTDFCQIAPEDFNPEDYRVSYDNQAPAGYAVETMRFTPSPKLRQTRLRQSIIASAQPAQEEPVKGLKVPKLNGITDLQRMIFTAELTQRLHHFQVDQTFEELVADAAAAADVELI